MYISFDLFPDDIQFYCAVIYRRESYGPLVYLTAIDLRRRQLEMNRNHQICISRDLHTTPVRYLTAPVICGVFLIWVETDCAIFNERKRWN